MKEQVLWQTKTRSLKRIHITVRYLWISPALHVMWLELRYVTNKSSESLKSLTHCIYTRSCNRIQLLCTVISQKATYISDIRKLSKTLHCTDYDLMFFASRFSWISCSASRSQIWSASHWSRPNYAFASVGEKLQIHQPHNAKKSDNTVQSNFVGTGTFPTRFSSGSKYDQRNRDRVLVG